MNTHHHHSTTGRASRHLKPVPPPPADTSFSLSPLFLFLSPELGYLSYVMDVATPTADCLNLVYNLLHPVVMKGHSKNTLSHQKNCILGEVEDQIKQIKFLLWHLRNTNLWMNRCLLVLLMSFDLQGCNWP